jgi:hypothetical protein
MAYIVKGAEGPVRRLSALANAGPDSWSAYQRQRDVYLLARMGNRDMQRLWNDWLAEDPGMARLVATSVEKERAQGAKVSAALDVRLREAERWVTKSGMITKQYKPPKPKKSGKRKTAAAAQTALLTKAAGVGVVVHTRQEAVMARIAADLHSDDPGRREIAAEILGRFR